MCLYVCVYVCVCILPLPVAEVFIDKVLATEWLEVTHEVPMQVMKGGSGHWQTIISYMTLIVIRFVHAPQLRSCNYYVYVCVCDNFFNCIGKALL